MKKILVINDDPDFQLLLKSYLHRQGYDADTINDTDAIIPKIEAFLPDLIVLDVVKERDLAICKNLQQNEKFKGMRIVLLADQKTLPPTDCKPAAIIRKPFQPTAFLKKISELLLIE
ncbi:MAG: response regulator [Flavitalea sp.]